VVRVREAARANRRNLKPRSIRRCIFRNFFPRGICF
jgi:hypothetical protein